LREAAAEEALLALQLGNLKRLQEAQKQYVDEATAARLKAETEINERLIQMGYDVADVTAAS